MFDTLSQQGDSFEKLGGPAGVLRAAEALRALVQLDVGSLHGSSSGSLVDILRQGLVATGRQQNVSFTGEMMGGILSSSLNSKQTSVVELNAVETAFSYMNKNLIGWHPSRSEDLVRQSEHWMRQGGAPEESISEWRTVRGQIEQARLLRWETLNPEVQQMISHPFPVLYGISSSVVLNDTATSVKGEKSVSEVSPDKLTVFVPDAQLSSVVRIAEECGSVCRVLPLSLLA